MNGVDSTGPSARLTQYGMLVKNPGWVKKWNIHALHRYLLNTGFVFVDH